MHRSISASLLGIGLSLSVATAAIAGNVTLVNSAPSGTWHYSIQCTDASGNRSNAVLHQLAAGMSQEDGDATCETFTIRFSSSNGDRRHYQLHAGRRYKYFWNVTHWDLASA